MRLQPFLISNDLLNDPEALRARVRRDGYLFFRALLDPETVLSLRREILALCRDAGWLVDGTDLMDARAAAGVRHVEPEAAYMEVYDALQRLERFHALAHGPALLAAYRTLFDEEPLVHARNIARIIFPQNTRHTTPPHQDFVHIQGTPETYTSWIPLGDCPVELGSLSVLPGSHRAGVLAVRPAMGAGGLGVETDHLDGEWAGGDFRAGDVLCFQSLCVHRALPNLSPDTLRLSVDYRYQALSQPLVEASMQPHYNRLTWEEIYAGWRSSRYQFYWRDRALQYVAFDRSHHEQVRRERETSDARAESAAPSA